MNKICKEYMGEVKALFPIKKKSEKAYLRKLTADVEGYCEEANVTTKQELYDNYGMPYEVVSNYFSTVDNDHLVKLLRNSRLTRIATIVLLVLATIATTMYVSFLLHSHNVLESNRVVIEETIIEDYGSIEDTYNEGFFADEFH